MLIQTKWIWIKLWPNLSVTFPRLHNSLNIFKKARLEEKIISYITFWCIQMQIVKQKFCLVAEKCHQLYVGSESIWCLHVYQLIVAKNIRLRVYLVCMFMRYSDNWTNNWKHRAMNRDLKIIFKKKSQTSFHIHWGGALPPTSRARGPPFWHPDSKSKLL